MTDDIVDRLRSLADCDARAGEPLGKCMREAADHIEELEKFKSIHAKCDEVSLELEQKLVLQLAECHRENGRLRSALQEIAGHKISVVIPDDYNMRSWTLHNYVEIREIARAALGEKTND